ncbi:MAG: class I SAM-dependent methyltransferase [Candidatus Omnitrophota bacterium]|nr:MAG: class I SAM-dependent methyltransferase [Candidatus Omnitrophota bacterium]
MDKIYIENRDKSYINRYKLSRRMRQILSAIQNYKPGEGLSLLEIGAADGILLEFLHRNLNLGKAIGIEPSLECIQVGKHKSVKLVQAIGERLPFRKDCFDIIVAASVIDHLTDVNMFLNEAHRVLKSNGILVLTAVVPFYDRLANITGLDKGLHSHVQTFNTPELKNLLEENQFKTLLAERFALPSFGLLPFENAIEHILKKLRLGFIMFYSLIVAENNSGN